MLQIVIMVHIMVKVVNVMCNTALQYCHNNVFKSITSTASSCMLRSITLISSDCESRGSGLAKADS